ncbi:MAG: tRNA pseudouridine(38-40) synthase TruA [Candidatus Eremiobacteraeota bacterium]|nr:tRNA pseudouridine(38-40) synthase TruA [Candidatus Eremiobacteraeota bacterium]
MIISPTAGEQPQTTVRLTLEYDGTNFCGFQWQPAVRTVAGVLEAALSELLAEHVKVAAAGRTDSGVHASGQVVSFSTQRRFPFDRLCIALNAMLPRDIAIRRADVVDDPFSARFSALERTYVYAIYNRAAPAPLLARYAYHVWLPLELQPMRAAAAQLLGEHDFRSFCAELPQSGVTVRAVRELNVERRTDLLRVEIRAGGFLHRMVRTIVGTLVDCGTGRREARDVAAMLDARDRRAAGHTVPSCGLYFAGVRYADGYDSYGEPPIFGWSDRYSISPSSRSS